MNHVERLSGKDSRNFAEEPHTVANDFSWFVEMLNFCLARTEFEHEHVSDGGIVEEVVAREPAYVKSSRTEGDFPHVFGLSRVPGVVAEYLGGQLLADRGHVFGESGVFDEQIWYGCP